MAQRTTSKKSEILASQLSVDVMAQKILTFLQRPCLKQVLKVPALSKRFRLTECYCERHGTKLEASVDMSKWRAREADEEAEDVKEEKIIEPVAQGSEGMNEETKRPFKKRKSLDLVEPQDPSMDGLTNKKFSTKKLHCEDCLHAEQGRARCKRCDSFEQHEDFVECTRCQDSECNDCYYEDTNFFFCSTCEEYYCGQGGCPIAWGCDICYTLECWKCKPDFACGKCGRDDWHQECGLQHGPLFSCSQCEQVYCLDCKDHFVCEECDKSYCHQECQEPTKKKCCGKLVCQACIDAGPCSACHTKT